MKIFLHKLFILGGEPFLQKETFRMIEFLENVILLIDDNTIVMPGHGDIASRNDIEDTVKMLKNMRERILNSIKKGESLEAVLNSKITKDYDSKYNTISMRGMFIDRAYTSLKKLN